MPLPKERINYSAQEAWFKRIQLYIFLKTNEFLIEFIQNIPKNRENKKTQEKTDIFPSP